MNTPRLSATRSIAEHFDAFSGLVDDMFCPMQVERTRHEAGQFSARLDATDLHTLRLVKVSSPPILVHRRPQDIARLSDPAYLIKFQLKGESLWSQRGRQVHIRPGDFVVCSTAEPYSITFFRDYEMPVLVVPRHTMCHLTADPDQFLGQRMSGQETDCGLLSSFVGQVVARMHALPKPMLQSAEASVLDLLGAVFAARCKQGKLTREQLLTQVKLHIQDRLHDRQLGPVSIAHAFSVSTRLIHALFEEEPLTVGKYIRDMRVNACRKAMESCNSGHLSLTDLALQYGFYDLSHMSRSFREVYGEPPSRMMQFIRLRNASDVESKSTEGSATDSSVVASHQI